MKRFKLSQAIGIGALSFSISVLPLAIPASAQQTAPSADNSTSQVGDVNFNWGWLGLLGLIGLAGLAGKGKRRDDTDYRINNPATRPGDPAHRASDPVHRVSDPASRADDPPRYRDPNVPPPGTPGGLP